MLSVVNITQTLQLFAKIVKVETITKVIKNAKLESLGEET